MINEHECVCVCLCAECLPFTSSHYMHSAAIIHIFVYVYRVVVGQLSLLVVLFLVDIEAATMQIGWYFVCWVAGCLVAYARMCTLLLQIAAGSIVQSTDYYYQTDLSGSSFSIIIIIVVYYHGELFLFGRDALEA